MLSKTFSKRQKTEPAEKLPETTGWYLKKTCSAASFRKTVSDDRVSGEADAHNEEAIPWRLPSGS